jgi:hypothetical protein
MAAGLGFKTFTTGEVLTAGDTNGYLMQGVLVFADAAARSAAITSPQEGQTSYLKSDDTIYTYSGSAWVAAGGLPSQTGNSGKYLTTNGTDASWATVSGGGMTSLASGNLSGINTLTLSSISQDYKNLQLVLNNVSTASNSFPQMRLNNDSGTTYYYQYGLSGSFATRDATEVRLAEDNLNFTTTANTFVIDIPNYKNVGGTVYSLSAFYRSVVPTFRPYFVQGGYQNSATIDRIDIINTSAVNWDAGSYVLYGVK